MKHWMVEAGGQSTLRYLVNDWTHLAIRMLIAAIVCTRETVRERLVDYEGRNKDFVIGSGAKALLGFCCAQDKARWTFAVTNISEGMMTRQGRHKFCLARALP